MKENGYSKGGDVTVYKKVYPTAKISRSESLSDLVLQGTLKNVEIGNEMLATIKTDQLHWVNLVGLTKGLKLSPFGGKITEFVQYKVWDSNVGVRYFSQNVFGNITLIKF